MSQFLDDPQNDHVDWYRKKLLTDYNIDTSNFSNEDLIFRLGQGYEGQGTTMSGMREQFGDTFTDQYYDLKNRPRTGQSMLDDAGDALSSSASGLVSTGLGALGLGAGAVGLDSAEEYLMGKAGEFSQDAADSRPTVDRASDVRWDRPAEVARFLMGGIGEALPSAVESAGAYVAGGGIGGAIVKREAKKAIRKAIQESADQNAADVVREIGKEVLKQKGRQGFATGSAVALGTSSIGLGVGEIYTELYESTKLDPNDPNYVDPDEARRVSVAFGALSGGLDFAGAGQLLGKLTGATGQASTKYLKRLLMGLPEGVIVEGGTEAVQEFINVAAEKYAKGMEFEFSDQEMARLFDAGVLGAIGGTQFTAIGAIKGPKDTKLPDDPIDTAPVDATEEKQKELLDRLRDLRAEDARYKIGDEVQVQGSLSGDVVRVSGDQAEVKLSDGTLKTVPMWKLSLAIDPKDQIDETPTPVSQVSQPSKLTPTPKVVSESAGEYPSKPTGPFKLPESLSKAQPRYGRSEPIQFETDLDRAAYIISSSNASKARASFEESIKSQGYNVETVRSHGQKVRDAVKKYVKDQTGTAQAGAKTNGLRISVPDAGFVQPVPEASEKAVDMPKEGRTEVLKIDIGGVEKQATDLTLKEVREARELYDLLYNLAQGDEMMKSRARAIREGGFASNNELKIKSRLGNKAGLYTKRNKEILAELGALNGSYEWNQGTKRDKELDAGVKQAEVEKRNDYIAKRNKWMIEGSEVSVTGSGGHRGKILEVTDEGMIKVDGWDEEVFPHQVNNIRQSQPRPPRKSSSTTKPKGENKTDIEDQIEQVEEEPRILFEQDEETGEYKPNIEGFDFKGKKIRFVYRSGKNISTGGKTDLIEATDQESFADGVRAWIEKIKGSVKRAPILNDVFAIEIDGQRYDASIEENDIYVAGLKVTPQNVVNREKKKGSIPGSIKSMEIVNIYGSDANDLDLNINRKTSVAPKRFFEGASQIARTKTGVVLRMIQDGEYPEGSIRVVTLIEGSKKVANGYSSDIDKLVPSTNGVIKLKGTPGKQKGSATFDDYEVIGKITFNDTIPNGGKMDIYFDDFEALTEDKAFKKAEDEAKVARDKEQKDLDDAVLAQEEANQLKAIEQENLSVDEKRAINTKIAEKQKVVDKATKANSEKEKLLKKYAKRIETYQSWLEAGVDDSGKKYTKKKFDQDVDDLPTREEFKALGLNEKASTKAGDFLEEMVSGDVTYEAGEDTMDLIEGQPEQQAGKEEVGSDAMHNVFGKEKGPKKEVVEDIVATSGTGQVQVQDIEYTEFLKVISKNPGLLAGFADLFNRFQENKLSNAKGDPSEAQGFIQSLSDFAQDFYTKTAGPGKAFSAFEKVEVIDDKEVRTPITDVTQAPKFVEFVTLINGFIEQAEGGNFKKATASRTNYIGRAKKALEKGYSITQILFEALNHMGHGLSSPVRDSIENIIEETEVGADSMNVEQILEYLNEEGLFSVDGLMDTLGRIYDLSVDEIIDATEAGPEIQEKHFYLLDDLRNLINPNYTPPYREFSTADDMPRGSRWLDPEAENKVNQHGQHVPNLVDPSTGKLIENQVIVTDDASADVSLQNARNSSQSYMAPLENPLERDNPDLLEEGRAAMRKFSPEGTTMSLGVALNQIKATSKNLSAIANVARLVDNKVLSNIKVEFTSWEDFRPYASPAKGVLNKAVHISRYNKETEVVERRILISEAFNNRRSQSAMDNLMADIVHEAIHAITKPALDLGYAYSTGKQEVIESAIATHGNPSGFNMKGEVLGEIFNEINTKLIPHLREKAELENYYGLTSIDEFFSEFASNPKFQKFLRDTPLPKSLIKRKSFGRTVMDFIQTILAKLGFASAVNDTALDYARGELDKLMKLSNETSEMYDAIEKENLRGINANASRFDEDNSPDNSLPTRQNARPDDNARVMAESNAAGFNEMVEELIKVHRMVGEELDMDVDQFIEVYGRPGRTSPKKIRSRLDKDLAQFEIESDSVRIESAGLNKVARNFGTRKAVGNLERVRETARKNKSSTALLIEKIERKETSNRQFYEDLIKGNFPPRDKLIERLKTRLNAMSFQKLEEYIQMIPNSGMSQADLNAVESLTKEELGGIMDAVVEARGELEYMSKEDLMNQLESLSDSRLSPIRGDQMQQKVRRMAVMSALRESKDVLSILRLSKGLVGAPEQKFKDAATLIAVADSVEAIDNVEKSFPGTQGTPLRHFARLKKSELEESKILEKERAQEKTYDLIDRVLGERSARLRMALGELEPVSIHDGVTLVTLVQKDGKWIQEKFKVEFKNGKLEKRDEFIRRNKDTLRGLRDPEVQKQFSHEPWYEIMREQAMLALTEPVLDEHFHAQRAAWYSGLQGMTERFSKLGYQGKKLSQMSTRTVALYREYAGKSMAYSKQFNASFNRVKSKLKVGGNELYSGLYQDMFWWLDNHPEFAGNEDQAFTQLWRHLRENANVPDRTKLDEEARRLVKDMMQKGIAARDWEAQVNRKLGNRVRDEEIKVESFVNGEMVDFYRLPLEMGYATMPRTLNDIYLLKTNDVMRKAGWDSDQAQDLLRESATASAESMGQIYQQLFTPEVVERFVKPYTNTDVRQSVFRGPKDEDGYAPNIGNSFISQAFKDSGGDIFEMSTILYEQLGDNQNPADQLEWQHTFLKQFFSRYKQITKVAGRVSREKHGMHSGDSMRNTPQSLDARMVESRLPKEFFYYNMYDEVSSNIRLALMTATASFGRNGDNANKAYAGGRKSLEKGATDFNYIMAQATNSVHDKPRATYTKAQKRKAFELLREDGSKNAEKDWNNLYSQAIAIGELEVVYNHLGKYYGKDNVSGPYKDANLLLEILGTQSMQVLNNPKSSFWQALALFEFPNAFRGLNSIAGKATSSALGNFVNQTFGGVLEGMGVELEKTGRYAQYLNNTHYRMDEMELPFKEYMSQVGSGGDLAQNFLDNPALSIKKYIRMASMVATHHRKKGDGSRAPIDPMTPFLGIFPYINNVVNHSVGVGAINAYSDLVIRASEVIRERGLTEFTELTAADLDMGNKSGEWIMGEEDGYDRANEMLVSAGGPSISRLAFDFVDRQNQKKDSPVIEKDMALLINQVAMNNVSGEGFNSKPAWLYTSPAMRYFNTFLGWPLGKMSRDLQFIFRDPNDKVRTYKALLKYIGLMSTVYVPVGLSFAMLIDWYDEEMLEKPNNLPPISPWAALPVLGLPMAMRDENFSIYSVTSRMAKAGVPFGMGMDVMNSIFAKGDPYGAARELSLDSRIFAWNMFKNIYDAVGTWIHAGEFDWQLVGRPIAYGVGGNSVIQMMDLTTALFDIDSEERRVADYIGIRNHIKKTAFMMGLPLRPPYKGGGKQSPFSINTRQMARAAYANDTDGFLKQYQEAIEAAKKHISDNGVQNMTPEKYVADGFKDRDLRHGITARRISDSDWQALLNILDPEVRQKIEGSIAAHQHYLRLIGGGYREQSMRTTLSREEARQRAALLL
jgi:hypothetical protein